MSRLPLPSDAETDTEPNTSDPTAGRAPSQDGECTLCSFPTPADPITAGDVDGTFCCQGCLEVHRTLETVDDTDADTVRERLDDEGPDLDEFDGEDAFLAVDGMHCSTCEAFLETRATATDGIEGAEASYATDTLRLVYDPDSLETSSGSDSASP
ncbi:MAG: cation transporter, partial [Natrinema limicola]